jgi:hypothetical protein
VHQQRPWAPASRTAVSLTKSWNAAPQESMLASTATMQTVRPFNRADDIYIDRRQHRGFHRANRIEEKHGC